MHVKGFRKLEALRVEDVDMYNEEETIEKYFDLSLNGREITKHALHGAKVSLSFAFVNRTTHPKG